MAHPRRKEDSGVDVAGLVKRARDGNREAQTQLFEHTKGRLFRFCVYLSGDAILAADLCQDTFVYALHHLRDLKEPGGFVHWLHVVARNKFLDHVKSPRNKPKESIDRVAEMARLFEPGDREVALSVQQTLSQMDPKDRLVLLLVHLEGYTYVEAANIMKVSEAATRSRLHRARETFVRFFSGS